MAGKSVIRDSDDEDSDDDAAYLPLPAPVILSMEIGKFGVESSAPNHLQHSGEPSTGSTGIVNLFFYRIV